MKHDADILIAGGGLNGTSLALAFASAGLSVVIAEPRPTEARADAAFDGRSYALALTSQRLLKVIGVWDRIAQNSQPILEIKVSDGRAGEGPSPFVLEFDHAEIEEGPMGFMMEDRHLRRALLEAVAAEDLIDQRQATVTGHRMADGLVVAELSDGTEVKAHLLVGCDGKTSATAQRAGIRRRGWEYRQTALVCAIEHEKPHGGIAHQFFMPPGPLAVLPLPGNRSSIVWSESRDEAARITNLDEAAYLDVLRPRFGDFLGEIGLAGARWSYPLGLSFTERWIAERVALLGDAAHAMHPIAGQGLNAGLKDVAALAEVLADARRRGEDIGRVDVLERYERWRRFDTTALLVATDTFNRLFSNDNSILRIARDLGMGAVNAMPALRRGFIREAAGLTGDLPRLLQGRPV